MNSDNLQGKYLLAYCTYVEGRGVNVWRCIRIITHTNTHTHTTQLSVDMLTYTPCRLHSPNVSSNGSSDPPGHLPSPSSSQQPSFAPPSPSNPHAPSCVFPASSRVSHPTRESPTRSHRRILLTGIKYILLLRSTMLVLLISVICIDTRG
jgi:hypothetical protein